MTEKELQKVLEQVNKVRHALAYSEGTLTELPKGKRTHQNSCVLARALKNGWTSDVSKTSAILKYKGKKSDVDFDACVKALKAAGFKRVYKVDRCGYAIYQYSRFVFNAKPYGVTFSLTAPMQKLVKEFDAGMLPELIGR